MSTTTPSVAALRRAIEITEQIGKLETELRGILDGKGSSAPAAARSVAPAASAAAPGKKRRKMSPEARARIVAAQKARWAKVRAAKKQ
jgi:hypothetical protein